ncbi:MAG: hypothetical protein FWD90_13675 [Defluviitaleaceae bacterium]|nr:hypothetical protein [Defluviitaleaceae bacterium]
MHKKTGELDFELKRSRNIHHYIKANEGEFDDKNFYSLFKAFITESGKTKAKIIADAFVSVPYFYNLLRGEKRPTRDIVVKLSFGLGLSLEDSERLLKTAGYGSFYVRHKRDAILKYALENNYNLTETDEMLGKHGFSIISE